MARGVDYFKKAPRGQKQWAVTDHYLAKGYKSNPTTLVVGALEELGEVAKIVLQSDPNYTTRPNKRTGDLEHEIIDVMVYLCALATAHGIDLEI